MQQVYVTFLVMLVWFGMDRNADHGTAALWMSLEGCYRNGSVLTSRDLSRTNGPRGCFRECPASPYIGLQENMCFCIAKPGDPVTSNQCSLQCEGEIDMLCGSHSMMSLFSRVTPQPNISVNGDIGFAYVHLSHSRSGLGYDIECNATSDIYEQHNYICYVGFSHLCTYFDSNPKTWQQASRSCQDTNQDLVTLQSLNNVSSCSDPQGLVRAGGYWIGMIWIKPASSTLKTISPSTRSTQSLSLSKSTSTSTLPSTSISPSTPAQTSTSTNIWKPGQDSTTLSAGKTSDGSTSDGKNVVYVAVPVVVVVAVILGVLVSVVVCWKKNIICFNTRQNSVEQGRNGNDILQEKPEVNKIMYPNGRLLNRTNSNNASRLDYVNENIAREKDSGIQNETNSHRSGSYKEYYGVESTIGNNVRNEPTNFENYPNSVGMEQAPIHSESYDMKEGDKKDSKKKKKRKKKKEKKKMYVEKNEGIENSTEDHRQNKEQSSVSSMNPEQFYPNSVGMEQEPFHRESYDIEEGDQKERKKNKKKKREEKKKWYVEKNEEIENNTEDHVSNSNRQNKDQSSVSSMNPEKLHAKNEDKKEKDKSKHKKKKKRKHKKKND